MIRSPLARFWFRCAKGALQFVPPHGNDASFWAFVITESRGLSLQLTTFDSNGITSACGLRRRTAAATRAATSMHRTFDELPCRSPVTAECIEPDTSGKTYTLPG